jgi:hypothetical protein
MAPVGFPMPDSPMALTHCGAQGRRRGRDVMVRGRSASACALVFSNTRMGPQQGHKACVAAVVKGPYLVLVIE